jgi:hypothetical protein
MICKPTKKSKNCKFEKNNKRLLHVIFIIFYLFKKILINLLKVNQQYQQHFIKKSLVGINKLKSG